MIKPINVNIDNFNQLKERQKELINTSLPKEKKQKALDRVEENSDIKQNMQTMVKKMDKKEEYYKDQINQTNQKSY